MTAKKILFLHADLLLGTLFRERMEEEGFAVEVARSGDEGLASIARERPDAVVLDPILPGPDVREVIRKMRASGGAQPIPVIALATNRPPLADAVQGAGADVVMPRGVNPIASVIDELQTRLGLEQTCAISRGLGYRADSRSLKMSSEAAPGTLSALRRALHEATREGGDPTALRGFLQDIHGLSEQMALFGERSLHCFAAQIEALAFDTCRFPDLRNPSILRTLGQAIDFLFTLLPDAGRGRLRDPSSAQVLVVDDEDGARKIIMAALQLANLKSMAANTPTSGLAALGVQGFDLIFLDVGLPEMTGFELATKIRALPLHEKTPIVFITGMATFQNRVQSSLSGGQDFVGKPFNMAELGLKAMMWIFKGQLGQV